MGFSMEVVNEKEVKAQIEEQVKPVSEEMQKIKETADKNVAEIMKIDPASTSSFSERTEMLQSVESFGLDTLRSSASKNSLLKVSVGKLSKSGDEGGAVAKGLTELQTQFQDLDPSIVDFTKSGFLGKLFNPLRAYFKKYQRADAVIGDIVESLDKGKRVLTDDNKTLLLEQQTLREITKKLQTNIELGSLMDQSIEASIEQAKMEDENAEKVRFVTEEILFPLRQRVMDMQQMLVVNQQGIIAYEVVMRNNKELIRGVERAKTVTLSALRNAVTVASALYNQKIVLSKIESLNKTTNMFISGTSKMLKEQGADIQKQAMETGVSVETLKQAFVDVLSALDSISAYKQEALPKMRETISQFRELADSGEKQIKRFENGSHVSL
ncbi:toxic anion resistance protein [Sporolactobacillus shoreicorticis]|uniref:Toxic anion resistance protein n=1 Tax=Sporolactobacillus shoreicorticis TaxID=1923877 RepID=A0ABW5S2R2_9BACL|nr:toxic anion resistance protein [Sporolactobacillus shoreicorticis]MCO7126462.1 toxic anion resistance protein [Sporolactobacillus shoreicorticis]